MSARTVREDQHGTATGYTYGCRCSDCRSAARLYRKEFVSDEILSSVFAAIEHEADMDGLTTATGERLGELAGCSRESASVAIHLLAEQGRVEIVGRVGKGGVLEVQLVEPP